MFSERFLCARCEDASVNKTGNGLCPLEQRSSGRRQTNVIYKKNMLPVKKGMKKLSRLRVRGEVLWMGLQYKQGGQGRPRGEGVIWVRT